MSSFVSSVKSAAPVKTGKKYFTLDEAQRSLTLIKRIAADLQSTQIQRLRLHAELSTGLTELPATRQEWLQKEFDRATTRLEELMEEMAKIGVDLKDPTRALVDFPCVHQGREILLCWKADEPAISHWHDVESGFAGRKSIALLHV